MLTNSRVPFKAWYPSRTKTLLHPTHIWNIEEHYIFQNFAIPYFKSWIVQKNLPSIDVRNFKSLQMMYHLDIILDTAITEHLLSPHLTWNVISDNVFLSICQLLLFVFMPWLLLHVWKWIILSAGIQFFYSLNLKLRNEQKKYKNSAYNWT